jgi:hypothetical protein
MTTDARFRDTLKSAMCLRPLKSDSITAASIYHAVDREHPTLLIDEADNLGLAFNGPLRAVLNSGHRRGGKVTRYHGGHARSFSTFSPVAVAATARCRCRSCTAALVLGRTGAAGKSAARDVAPCTHRRSGPIALMGCG